MKFTIRCEERLDGSWLAEIRELNVNVESRSAMEALGKVQAMALRELARRIETGQAPAGVVSITFVTG